MNLRLQFLNSPSGRRISLGTGFTLVVVILGILYVRWQPYRVANEFIQAIENRDARTLYRLATPQEKREFGLTEQGIRRILSQMFERPVKLHFLEEDSRWYTRLNGQPQLEQYPRWKDKTTDKPLWNANINRQVLSHVIVLKTEEGWRVNTGMFLWTTWRTHFGKMEGKKWSPSDKEAFVALAKKNGITGYYDTNGGQKNL